MWQDATAMAEAVKKRQVSAEELVKASIEKIERLNPTLNAVVYKQYEEALQIARHLTDKTAPFAGVPILLKDLGQSQKGHPSSCGSPLLQHQLAGLTDNYTTALQGLGFIVVGRTNVPEFGFKNISDSRLHGAVSLPADVSRNAGGSSGGSAAAVSSGMVPIAGASDGGGSIRIPASFNGLIGLKPTRGRIPVGPGSYRGWQGASVQFAMTRSVRDTRRLLYHLQTCQMESPFPLPLLDEQDLSADKLRLLNIAFTTSSPIGTLVSEHAKRAVSELVAYLEKQGHNVTELARWPIDGVEAMQSYYLMNSVETAQMFDGIESQLGREMTLSDMELMTWGIYCSGQQVRAKDYSRAIQLWDHYSAVMATFHEQYDLLLTPTVADVAPKHGQFDLAPDLQGKLQHMAEFSQKEQQTLIWEMFADSLAWTPFTQHANLTGQPAISLPTYETPEGLPIGVQVIAAKGREDLLLSLAEKIANDGFLKIKERTFRFK